PYPDKPVLVLSTQSYGVGRRLEPEVDIRLLDLSGCPKTCTPQLAAKWGLPAQFSLGPSTPMSYPGTTHSLSLNTHEAVMSTDGKRIYMAQMQAGFLMLDSTRLVNTMRSGGKLVPNPGPTDCNPAA